MKKRTYAMATAILIFAASAFATQNAAVTLHIEPDHYLVSLEAMVSIVVANIGAEPVQLSGRVRIRAIAPDGTSSILQQSNGEAIVPGQYPFAESYDPRLRIPALRTETFYLRTFVTTPDTGVFRPLFLYDHHFDVPGKYLLRAEVLSIDPAVSFLSDQVILKIDAPHGRDAAVLALVRASTDQSENVSSHIAYQILTGYSDSTYAPYWVVDYHTTNEILRETLYNDAIQRAPESYATELKLTLLRWDQEKLMAEAIDRFDLSTALAYREKAKARAQDLSKSRFPYAATAATAALDELPTPAQLQRQYNDRIQKFSAASGLIVPFVQCVDRGTGKDDSMITIFGYDSANTMGKYIPRGGANRLRPDDATASVPVYFGPGHIPRAGDAYPMVAMTRHEVAPSWSLDGGVATVSTATPACPPQQAGSSVTPLFDCLSGNGDDDNLSAVFGYNNPNPLPVRVPNGATNSFAGKGTPPTVFLPGEHHGVFTIQGKKDTTPAWTIQGETATASQHAIRCSSDHRGDD